LPLYVVIVLVACGVILLLSQLGQLAHRRAQARTAADAAALAGAAEGRGAAESVATANGAVLESFTTHGSEVDVTVRIGGTHATARASRDRACSQSGEPQHLHFGTCQPSSRA
jgi:uncharacterized membrane protein